MEHLRGCMASVTKFMDLKHFFFPNIKPNIFHHKVILIMKDRDPWLEHDCYTNVIIYIIQMNSNPRFLTNVSETRKLILVKNIFFFIYSYFHCAYIFLTSPCIIFTFIMDIMLLIIRFFDFIWFITIKKCRSVLTFRWAYYLFKYLVEKKSHSS